MAVQQKKLRSYVDIGKDIVSIYGEDAVTTISNLMLHNEGYCHYTTVHSADLILTSKTFRLGKIVNSNDGKENSVGLYALCFCTGKTEKLPMWYLYGGLEGNGVRIRITPALFKKLLAQFDKIHTEIDGKMSSDFLSADNVDSVKFGRVNYVDFGSKNRIKYCHEYFERPADDLDSKQPEDYFNTHFVKDYAWEYEKEARIVVKLKRRTDNEYPDALYITIPDEVYKKLELTRGPETSDEDKVAQLKLKGFKKWLNTKIEYSRIQSNMDYMKKLVAQYEGEYSQLCDKINSYIWQESRRLTVKRYAKHRIRRIHNGTLQ